MTAVRAKVSKAIDGTGLVDGTYRRYIHRGDELMVTFDGDAAVAEWDRPGEGLEGTVVGRTADGYLVILWPGEWEPVE